LYYDENKPNKAKVNSVSRDFWMEIKDAVKINARLNVKKGTIISN
jgi:hypothetical protein